MNFKRALCYTRHVSSEIQHPNDALSSTRFFERTRNTVDKRNDNRKNVSGRSGGASCNCGALQDFQSTGATLVGGIILLRQIESDAGRCIRPYGCQSSPGRKSWQDEENVTARTKRSNAQKERKRGRERESGWNGN